MDDTDVVLTSLRYCGMVSWSRVSLTMTLDTKDIDEREKLAREIARTSESIRKKCRAMKTGRMEQETELEKHFKPIVEPLKQIAVNIGGDDDDDSDVTITLSFESLNKSKRKRSSSVKKKRVDTLSPIRASTLLQPRKLTFDTPPNLSVESVFETDPSFVTSVRQTLQTSDGRRALYNQMGPLGQEYIGSLLSSDKKRGIDNVYGVYFNDAETFLGDKAFDIDRDDNLIVDGVKYTGTPGLFELIFKRLPDDTIYTEDDMQKSRACYLLLTLIDGHNAHLPILGNKGYKYKRIIAHILHLNKEGGGVAHLDKRGAGDKSNIPQAMTVTDNTIDYVHWDDPNKLVNRL